MGDRYWQLVLDGQVLDLSNYPGTMSQFLATHPTVEFRDPKKFEIPTLALPRNFEDMFKVFDLNSIDQSFLEKENEHMLNLLVEQILINHEGRSTYNFEIVKRALEVYLDEKGPISEEIVDYINKLKSDEMIESFIRKISPISGNSLESFGIASPKLFYLLVLDKGKANAWKQMGLTNIELARKILVNQLIEIEHAEITDLLESGRIIGKKLTIISEIAGLKIAEGRLKTGWSIRFAAPNEITLNTAILQPFK